MYRTQNLPWETGSVLIEIPEGYEVSSVSTSPSAGFGFLGGSWTQQGDQLWRYNFGIDEVFTISISVDYEPIGGGVGCTWSDSFMAYPYSSPWCCGAQVYTISSATCANSGDGDALIGWTLGDVPTGAVGVVHSSGTPINQIEETSIDGEVLLTNLNPGVYWVGISSGGEILRKVTINDVYDEEGPNTNFEIIEPADENNENASVELSFNALQEGFEMTGDFYSGPLDPDVVFELDGLDAGIYNYVLSFPESGCSWDMFFEIPEFPVFGCMEDGACNYNPAANNDDGSCTFPGCTLMDAPNYDPDAGCDDGSCELEEDITGDGDVGVEDLMLMLNTFGCLGVECEADINEDLVVNVQDLILILNVFGYGAE
ncbi:hypothetical protein [Sanyastnella coralliicola]|uniref:hypothetical protein n=1 Tax=Sanyastnella coralliicola TaxID=3069118 RepID=UPI0027B93F7E|nr:hypothetical protein [Longitalea sp. SCSIO 12813]